jgi:hypothetical protein
MSRLDRKIAFYREKGKIARTAHIAVKTAFREGLRKKNPDAYAALLHEFGAATHAATPENIFEDLATGAVSSVDNVVAFLASDAYFFRSGYLKQALIQKLKHIDFDKEQRACLETLVLNRIERPNQFHFADYARLAAFLKSPTLVDRIEHLALNPDEGVRQRAQRVLENIRQRRIANERTSK